MSIKTKDPAVSSSFSVLKPYLNLTNTLFAQLIFVASTPPADLSIATDLLVCPPAAPLSKR